MMPVLTVTQARWLVGMFGCWLPRDPPMQLLIIPCLWEWRRN